MLRAEAQANGPPSPLHTAPARLRVQTKPAGGGGGEREGAGRPPPKKTHLLPVEHARHNPLLEVALCAGKGGVRLPHLIPQRVHAQRLVAVGNQDAAHHGGQRGRSSGSGGWQRHRCRGYGRAACACFSGATVTFGCVNRQNNALAARESACSVAWIRPLPRCVAFLESLPPRSIARGATAWPHGCALPPRSPSHPNCASRRPPRPQSMELAALVSTRPHLPLMKC